MNEITEPRFEARHRWAAWVGFFVQLALAVFPLPATGLLAPIYAIGIVYLVWAVLLVFAWRWWNRRPLVVLLVPVMTLVFWFAVLTFGELVLDWTA